MTRLADCWVNTTWEHCCAAPSDLGTGDEECFSGDRFIECCHPRKAPRDIFRCHDRGRDWSDLRTGIIYARVFQELPDPERLRWRPGECFLGAVMSALFYLAIAAGSPKTPEAVLRHAWQHADDMVLLMLRSPVSVDEILLSGWHLGAILVFLRSSPRVEQIAGPWAMDPLQNSREVQFLQLLEGLPMAANLRVRQDLAFEIFNDPKSISYELASVLLPWSAAYNALLERWRHTWAEEREMVQLLRMGDAKLKQILLEGETPRPLHGLLSPPPFLPLLLQALHSYPVVKVDVNAALEMYPSFFHRASPHTWRGSRRMGRIPALELHPMPMDDGLSNANRATRMPFCLWPGFMATFGKMGQQQMSAELVDPNKQDHLPFVRVWEIGANMGDCSLLALHCVAAWGLRSAQPRPLLDVELTLFEPIEDALVSLNAAVKAFQQSQHAAGNLAQKPQILVQPIALGPKVGYTQIHLRRASSAEASFVGCHGFQGECEVQEVWMETLDHLLLGDVPPVDLLKIHVQGSELDVLRGAREALRQGRICVTYVMTHAARIGQFEEVSS